MTYIEKLEKLFYRKFFIKFLHIVVGNLTSAMKDNEADVLSWFSKQAVPAISQATPFPECKIQASEGEVLLAWPKDEEGFTYPQIIGWVTGKLTKLAIGVTTKPVARLDDDIKAVIDDPAIINHIAELLIASGGFVPSGTSPMLTEILNPVEIPGTITSGSQKVEVE